MSGAATDGNFLTLPRPPAVIRCAVRAVWAVWCFQNSQSLYTWTATVLTFMHGNIYKRIPSFCVRHHLSCNPCMPYGLERVHGGLPVQEWSTRSDDVFEHSDDCRERQLVLKWHSGFESPWDLQYIEYYDSSMHVFHLLLGSQFNQHLLAIKHFLSLRK